MKKDYKKTYNYDIVFMERCDKMKKGLILACCALFLVTGCGGKEKTTECTYSSEKSGIKIEGTYEIKSTGDYVDLVKQNEVYTAPDEATANQLKTNVETLNSSYKDLKGYKYSANVEGTKLTYSVEVNFEEMDMDEYVKINPQLKDQLVKNKIRLIDLVATYEAQKATCKEK